MVAVGVAVGEAEAEAVDLEAVGKVMDLGSEAGWGNDYVESAFGRSVG